MSLHENFVMDTEYGIGVVNSSWVHTNNSSSSSAGGGCCCCCCCCCGGGKGGSDTGIPSRSDK